MDKAIYALFELQQVCFDVFTRKDLHLVVRELRFQFAQSGHRIGRQLLLESPAQAAVDAIRLTVNKQTPQQLLKNVSVETLVKHYREHELPTFQRAETGSWNCGQGAKVLLNV